MNLEDIFTFDVETAGSQPNFALQPWRMKYWEAWIRTYAIAFYKDKKIVTRGWEYDRAKLADTLTRIADQKKIVVGWNVPYDVACLQGEGLIEETRRIKWFDAMILWKNLDRSRKTYGLKEAVAKFLPQFAGYEDNVDFEGDIQKLLEYNQLDARFTFWLTAFLWKQLTPREQNALMIDMEDIAEVAYANLRGVQISIQAVKDAAAFATKQREENYAKILPHLPKELDKQGNLKFNLDSDRQIADLLFNQWGLPVFKRTPKQAPSVDKESLLELAHLDERAKWIQQYRETTGYLSKCVSAVIESLKYNKSPADCEPKPIVHPELRKAGTYTDRCTYSSSQNTESKKRKKA